MPCPILLALDRAFIEQMRCKITKIFWITASRDENIEKYFWKRCFHPSRVLCHGRYSSYKKAKRDNWDKRHPIFFTFHSLNWTEILSDEPNEQMNSFRLCVQNTFIIMIIITYIPVSARKTVQLFVRSQFAETPLPRTAFWQRVVMAKSSCCSRIFISNLPNSLHAYINVC